MPVRPPSRVACASDPGASGCRSPPPPVSVKKNIGQVRVAPQGPHCPVPDLVTIWSLRDSPRDTTRSSSLSLSCPHLKETRDPLSKFDARVYPNRTTPQDTPQVASFAVPTDSYDVLERDSYIKRSFPKQDLNLCGGCSQEPLSRVLKSHRCTKILPSGSRPLSN